MKTLRHLDLCSGIGGFALAAQMVGGIETRQFVEIEPYCQKVLAKNFPGVPIYGDITTFTAKPGDFDLITGGFPCQPHSTAGDRKASQDERDLWPELYRIICSVQPRWCVFENVRGLLSSESGRFFRGILWDLARAGFDAEWQTVSASDVGAPHERKRVFIVAYSNSVRHAQPQLWSTSRNAKGNAESETESLLLAAWPPGPGKVSQIPREVDGLPRRLDAVRALGNAIVPQCGAIALQRVLDLECAT